MPISATFQCAQRHNQLARTYVHGPPRHSLDLCGSKLTMEDAVTPTGVPGDETSNQMKARLRREKMQKKLAESGEDRLNRIKALNGGVAPPADVLGGPAVATAESTTRARQATAEDPDEVDIDTISGTGTPMRPLSKTSQNDPFGAAMMQQQQGQRQGTGGSAEEDPMVKMMQQLSGMMGGDAQNPNDPNSQMPAMLQNLLSGAGNQDPKVQPDPSAGSAYLWRITHAVFALTLATYTVFTSTFNGSKLSRSQAVYTQEEQHGLGPRLFYIFATTELMLQSTRYFLEKGQLQGPGIFAKVANSGFVPEPYAGYVRIVGRYVGIFQTIVADAMVIVFVFGAVAWWQGLVEI
nr:golgi to er traffic protein 2 [Quercus suber]